MNKMETAFWQSIKDNPKDTTSALIYADWLEEHGRSIDADAVRFTIQGPPIEKISDLQGRVMLSVKQDKDTMTFTTLRGDKCQFLHFDY